MHGETVKKKEKGDYFTFTINASIHIVSKHILFTKL